MTGRAKLVNGEDVVVRRNRIWRRNCLLDCVAAEALKNTGNESPADTDKVAGNKTQSCRKVTPKSPALASLSGAKSVLTIAAASARTQAFRRPFSATDPLESMPYSDRVGLKSD